MKNNQKVFISIIIIVVVAVAGYFVLTKKSNNINTAELLPSVSSQTDTSNWKTYRNEELKYEIKYPADWKLLESNQQSLTHEVGFLSPTHHIVSVLLDSRSIELIKKTFAETKGIRTFQSTVNLSGLTAYQYLYSEPEVMKGGVSIYIQYNGNIYQIYADHYELEITKKILSTFKFTK